MTRDMTNQESHFAFGENWASYAKKIGPEEIEEAVKGLSRLLGGESLQGHRFMDIGCGSGLHSLAALRLGAAEVFAVDIDPASVETTRHLLARFCDAGRFSVEQRSIFDISPETHGQFDVVYSWGVLHHTGDMDRALRQSAAFVGHGAQFIFALYHRTWLCGLWKLEKRWYSNASARAQQHALNAYVAIRKAIFAVAGRSFDNYVKNYVSKRGMDFYHDCHDWLGGWPYESVGPAQVEKFMCSLGLAKVRSFEARGHFLGRHLGIFGSGCNEYVYHREPN